jgi:4-amino-4-deoxy-L-arabinose transferase-like glycosyltransferase
MRTWRASVRLEVLLYAVLIVIAVGLRFSKLDWPPLTEAEATQALAALESTPQASPFWSEPSELARSNVSYQVFTYWILQITGPADSGARLISALAGLGLVLAPLLLRRKLGAAATFATCLLLAISPVSIAAARTAGSGALAALWLAVAFGLGAKATDRRQRLLALASLGLAFTCGPSVFTGLLGWALGAAAVSAWPPARADERPIGPRLMEFARDLWMVPLVMLIVAGGLRLSLAGVGDLFQGLAVWFRDWASGGGVPALTELAALPIYEPLVLIFGIFGLGSALRRRDRLGMGAIWFAIGALLIVVMRSGRSPEDLIWVVMPLALLGGRATSAVVEKVRDSGPWEVVTALFSSVVVLAVFAYIQVATYAQGLGNLAYENAWVLPVLALAALGLAGMLMVFFGLNWSWRLALGTAGCAVFVVATALSLSAAWHISLGPKAASSQELWRPQATTQGIRQLVEILESTALASFGRKDELELRVEGELPSSVAWALDGFRPETTRLWQDQDQVPAILLPENAEDPKLEADYMGQTVTLGERWGWQGALPPDPVAWWITRRAPTLQDRWLVLIRADIATLGQYELPATTD